jgi:hypothetical protein
MAAKTTRNSYEENPDRLKDLLKKSDTYKKPRPPLRPRRDLLLKEHAAQLKLLAEGSVPVRSFVLPLPYPPSRISITNDSCAKVSLYLPYRLPRLISHTDILGRCAG